MGRRRHRATAAAALGDAEALAVAGAAGTTADADADADAAGAGAGGAAGEAGLQPISPAAPRKGSGSPRKSTGASTGASRPQPSPSSLPSNRRLALHVPGESGKLSTRAGAVSPGFNGDPGSPLKGGGPGELRIELMQRLARRLLDDLEALLPPSRPASRMSE